MIGKTDMAMPQQEGGRTANTISPWQSLGVCGHKIIDDFG